MMNPSKDSDSIHMQFVATLLHDLESPLAVTKQFLHRVVEGRHDPNNPAHQELVHSTHLAVVRAEKILRDVLDLTRAEASGLMPQPQEVDMRAVIQRCIMMVKPLADENNLKISNYIDSSLPAKVKTDEVLVERVIDNFLMNAIRHAPRYSLITIRLKCNQSRYCVEICNFSDDSDSVDYGQIFSPSYQTFLRKERRMRGSGLGLTFSRMVIEALEGTIGAKKNEDGNTTFWFELPL